MKNYSHFVEETKSLTNHLENQEQCLTTTDYQHLHQLNHQLWFHPDFDQFTANTTLLEKSIAYLDQSYFISKLFYGCELKNRSLHLKQKLPFLLIEEIKRLVKADNKEGWGLIIC